MESECKQINNKIHELRCKGVIFTTDRKNISIASLPCHRNKVNTSELSVLILSHLFDCFFMNHFMEITTAPNRQTCQSVRSASCLRMTSNLKALKKTNQSQMYGRMVWAKIYWTRVKHVPNLHFSLHFATLQHITSDDDGFLRGINLQSYPTNSKLRQSSVDKEKNTLLESCD